MAFSLAKLCSISSVAFLLYVGGPGWSLSGGGLALAQSNSSKGVDNQKDGKKNPEPAQKTTEKSSRKPAAKAAGGKAGADLGFETLDVSVKNVEKETMDKALDHLKNEDFAVAAIEFWEIYNNPKAKQFFQAAEYQLGKALYRMGLYHSALKYFGAVIDKGTEHKYFKTSLEWMFFISHKITDQTEVLKYIARYADMEFPAKYKDEFLFLLAKYFYVRALEIEKTAVASASSKSEDTTREKPIEEFGFDLSVGDKKTESKKDAGFGLDLDTTKKAGPTALPTDSVGFLSKSNALLLQISEKDKFYPKAKYLQGLIAFKQENFQAAIDNFREVVRLLHPKTGSFRDDKLRELAFFQLARTHYSHKQFRYALFYYDHIHRDSANWLESLFEASWAWFRLAKYQKALGNLITLDSPFFHDEYFPESLILKAVTYYENCRYPESNQIVDEFKRRYEPLFKELEKLTTKEQAPDNYYKQLLAIQQVPPEEGKSGNLLRRILKVALSDKDLQVLNTFVLEIERELERIGKQKDVFSKSKFATSLSDSLKRRRDELVKGAGLLTKRRLEQERDSLRVQIAQARSIVVENNTAEMEVLKKARTGEQDLGPTLLPYDWTAATDDEKHFWPYEGEYWRDELGTYEYTLTWGCRKQQIE
jgi:TolA-binding protein